MANISPVYSVSLAIKQEIQRFESVHPSIYAIYDLIEAIDDRELQDSIRDHVVCIEDSFVNSQEWTLSRNVPELKLGVIGSVHSGKSALVHRYLTGSYMQDESPEGGRFKKEVMVDGSSSLLLIRDEGRHPISTWCDACLFVFALDNADSFDAVYQFYNRMSQYRNLADMPILLVGTQDSISESRPRVIDEAKTRKCAQDLRRCVYLETCATYGHNVDRVFQEACHRIVTSQQAWKKPSAAQTPGQQQQQPGGSHMNARGGLYNVPPPGKDAPSDDATSYHSQPAQISRKPSAGTLSSSCGIGGGGVVAHGKPHRRAHVALVLVTVLYQTVSVFKLSLSLSASVPALADRYTAQRSLPHGASLDYYNPADEDDDEHPYELYDHLTAGLAKRPPPPVPPRPPPPQLRQLGLQPQPKQQPKKRSPLMRYLRGSLWTSSKDKAEEQQLAAGFQHADYSAYYASASVPSIAPGSCQLSLPPPPPLPPHHQPQPQQQQLGQRVAKDRSSFAQGSQGSLYKKAVNALNREWKKKYVTLSEDGKLTYHPNLHDYMENSPDWASLNLGALVCIECSGVHRQLGTHLSRIRSLTLDDWPANHLLVMRAIGNKLANSVWEARLPCHATFRKPSPESDREAKEIFIRAKYERREFLPDLPFRDSPVQQQLVDAIARSDTRQVILCLAVAGPAVNEPYSKQDPRAAIHIAATLGQLVYLQLLLWHGADVAIRDAEGRNAHFYATAAGKPDCAEFLRAAGCPAGVLPASASAAAASAASSSSPISNPSATASVASASAAAAASTLPRRRSKTTPTTATQPSTA
uniref:Arf-GAP domain-containing protein n=1 Tax=Macrostomum lignano TaxID=282301 RepID=A0A1I8G3R8_9PLAT